MTVFLFFTGILPAQKKPCEYAVLFYNVENLFDLKDNPETLDDDFTAGGNRYWTYERFQRKILRISKVIMSAGGWHPPGMVALCEVENRYVLHRLIEDTPLNRFPFKIIHKESPDDRGIDVAFLYNEEVFYPLEYQYFPLRNEDGSVVETREILSVSGIVGGVDTLHFFVNHWPSRYDGLLETQALRNLAAETLRSLVEAKQENYPGAKVIILGDFNDQPLDESIFDILKAGWISEDKEPGDIVNLSLQWLDEEKGTLKFRSQWSVFDQIMVSGSLLMAKSGITTTGASAQIVKIPFLFEPDQRYGGVKPFRTYSGYTYQEGFSDHLPVLLRLNAVH